MLGNVFPQVTSDNLNVEYVPSLSCVNHVVDVCYILYTLYSDEDHLKNFVFTVKYY